MRTRFWIDLPIYWFTLFCIGVWRRIWSIVWVGCVLDRICYIIVIFRIIEAKMILLLRLKYFLLSFDLFIVLNWFFMKIFDCIYMVQLTIASLVLRTDWFLRHWLVKGVVMYDWVNNFRGAIVLSDITHPILILWIIWRLWIFFDSIGTVTSIDLFHKSLIFKFDIIF